MSARGFGDTVASVTALFGVEPCEGCERRRAWLNAAIPYHFGGDDETEATSAPPLSVPFPRPWLDARARLEGPDPSVFRGAAETMREAWQKVHGRQPEPGELLFSLAVARLESGFGRGWKDPCRSSNNWGAVQCTKGQAPCCEYQDSHANGNKYAVGFRVYASPVDGAADVVRHVTTLRPLTWAVMRRGGTIWDFSRAMRVERYYGGVCPVATKAFGAENVVHYGKPPAGDAGKAACHEEAIAGHVQAVTNALRDMAPALGLEVPEVGAPGGVAAAVGTARARLVAAGVATAVVAAVLARWIRG